MIDVTHLIAAGIGPTQAKAFAEPLAEACERFSINTPSRIGGFLGQCMVESQRFTRLEEGLWYSTPERIMKIFPIRVHSIAEAQRLTKNPRALANVVYAGKNGNGAEASGDGWAYRGRGLIQLTGRANYQAAQDALGEPFVDQPDLVAQPRGAALTAAWFFAAAGCNELADAGMFNTITRKVNGAAMLEADLRLQLSEEAARVFA